MTNKGSMAMSNLQPTTIRRSSMVTLLPLITPTEWYLPHRSFIMALSSCPKNLQLHHLAAKAYHLNICILVSYQCITDSCRRSSTKLRQVSTSTHLSAVDI